MICLDEGENKGKAYSASESEAAPSGTYTMSVSAKGNFYYTKEDGRFTLIRK